MRDIVKLALTFFGIMAVVLVVGVILSSCGRDDEEMPVVEPQEQVVAVPTGVVEENPLTVRGTAAIGIQVNSIRNGFFEAIMYEVKPGEQIDQAVPVASVTQGEINHQLRLPTQWDFRMTIPNFRSENRYYVFGAVYATPQKLTRLLRGRCQSAEETEYCSVVGQGRQVNYWMELVPDL